LEQGAGPHQGLAEAPAMMWLRRSPVSTGFAWRSEIVHDLQPGRAVANLTALAAPDAARGAG
jgi:hypothetical protein